MATIELKKQDRSVEIEVEKRIKNEDTQKRYYIAELIKSALNQYLDYDDMRADSRYSAYTMPIVNETLDIIDFEINSLNVHVIPTIDKAKNQNVYIPKTYKIYNCKPDMLIFVNFTKGLTKMTIEGFTTDINLNTLAIAKSALRPVEALIDALKVTEPKIKSAEDGAVKTVRELMLAYIDSSLSEEGEQFFLKHFLSNKEIRKNYKLFYALNCQFISVAKMHTSVSDDSFVAVDSVPEEIYEDPVAIVDEPVVHEEIPDTASNFSFDNEAVTFAESEETQDALQSTFDDMVDALGVKEDTAEPEVFDISAGEPVELLTEDETETALNTADEIEVQTADVAEQVDITDNADISAETDDFSADDMTELDFSSFDEEGEFDLTSQDEDISLDETSEEPEAEVSPEQKIFLQESVVPQDANPEPVYEPPVEEQPQPQQAEEANPEISAESTEEAINDAEISGDDVFSFLSEMADEAQEQTAEITDTQAASQEEIPEMADTSQNEVQNEGVSVEDQPVQQVEQPAEEQTPVENIGGNATLNDAFAPQGNQAAVEYIPPQPQEQQAQPAKQSQKAKSSMGTIILIGALVATAAGIYFCKDYIPFFNNNSPDVQDLTVEKEPAKKPDLPPPIDDTAKLDVPKPITGETDTPSAPTDVPAAPAPPPSVATTTQPDKAAAQMPDKKNAENKDNVPSLPKAVEPPKPKNLNDAIATALTKDFSGVRISKVSWEVSETLVNNSDVKRYLTIAGKSIKNALSQDLMAATEPSFKDVVVADIIYKKDGSVSDVKISSSSGSDQIDKIIVKSIKDTLNYIKMPALNIDKSEYTAKLVVRL